MIPKQQRCPECGGTMEEGLVDLPFHSKQGREGVVRVTNVPAMVCGDCGYQLIHGRLLMHLERIGEDALAR